MRRRGKRSYEVRVRPFPSRYAPTKEAAEKLELDLLLRRSMGDLYELPTETLKVAIAGYLERRKAVGGRRGQLRPRSVEFDERSLHFWKEHDELAGMRLSALRRQLVEDAVAMRAAEHPRSAKNELEKLKAVLKDARSRGQRIDPLLLEIPAVGHRPRRGRALSVDELYELASWFPEHVKRLVLLAGQVGARQHYWFQLTDDMLDLEGGTMRVDADVAKNRRDHRVYLTPLEVQLFREQLLARTGRTRLVFPTVTGKQWTRSGFRERVWAKVVAKCAKHDREKAGGTVSVYDGFTFHFLRHTAGSLMALAGMDPAIASDRLGHTDGGALYLRTYRHLYEQEKKREAAKLGRLVERELKKAAETAS